MPNHGFEVGHVYRRKTDIHDVFGGQSQGGISTPAAHPLVFLITGESGSTYGYSDRFTEDGTYWYTGEGQVGDQKMAVGNAAIKHHEERGKTLLLFADQGKGQVRFMGEAAYLGDHLEVKPDRNGALRNVIVFELALEADPVGDHLEAGELESKIQEISERRLWKVPLDQLRQLALLKLPSMGTPPEQRKKVLRARSEAVRVYVLRRAGNHCEGCTADAPFLTPKGRPYLEPHHLRRLADGGPDHPKWVIALCPTCHRRSHYAVDGTAFNATLMSKMPAIEGN